MLYRIEGVHSIITLHNWGITPCQIDEQTQPSCSAVQDAASLLVKVISLSLTTSKKI